MIVIIIIILIIIVVGGYYIDDGDVALCSAERLKTRPPRSGTRARPLWSTELWEMKKEKNRLKGSINTIYYYYYYCRGRLLYW